MLVLGLTGSLGMGKSTVAAMFADEGAAVFDADRAVHQLYRGAAGPIIAAAFPGTVRGDVVDRDKLAAAVVDDPPALARLEGLIHPLVAEAEVRFRAAAVAAGRRIAVLDVPLLLETGGERRVDAVVMVTAPGAIQRERVFARGTMSEQRFAALLARQMPEKDKRARAHFVIDNGGDVLATRKQVEDILRAVTGMAAGR